MYNYAQLNEANICVGVSSLSGEVPEFNYMTKEDFNPVTGVLLTETVFLSRMIRISMYSNSYLGLRYTAEGKWAVVK